MSSGGSNPSLSAEERPAAATSMGRCQRGRSGPPAKRLYGLKSVPRVRIPPFPPHVTLLYLSPYAPVAQGIERWVADPKAAGSNPAGRTTSPRRFAGGFCISRPADEDRIPGRRLGPAFAKLSGGEVSEWLMVPLSKSGLVMSQRGFESHPLRHTGWLLSRAGASFLEGSHSLA